MTRVHRSHGYLCADGCFSPRASSAKPTSRCISATESQNIWKPATSGTGAAKLLFSTCGWPLSWFKEQQSGQSSKSDVELWVRPKLSRDWLKESPLWGNSAAPGKKKVPADGNKLAGEVGAEPESLKTDPCSKWLNLAFVGARNQSGSLPHNLPVKINR